MADHADAREMTGGSLAARTPPCAAPARAREETGQDIDMELVRRCRQGDRQACAEVFHRLKDSLYALVRSMGRHQGPEWVEDTFGRVNEEILRSLSGYRSDITFKGWALRVCHNVCISELREAGRQHDLEAPLPDDTDVEDDSEVDMSVLAARRQMLAALDRIPEMYRSVFIVHHLLGCSARETGKVLGLRTGTVKSRAAEARAKLKRTMPPSFWEGFA